MVVAIVYGVGVMYVEILIPASVGMTFLDTRTV